MLEHNLLKYKMMYIFLIAIVSFPILVLSNNIWDGAIVNYSFAIDDLSGLKNWFFESRWNLQYYLYLAIYTLAHYLNISEDLIIKILVVISLIGISFEVKYLARYLLKLPVTMAYMASFFALLFPAWHVLISSIMVIHILCIWFVLLGFRLIKHPTYRYFGFILLLISLQLNSNFMFLFFMFISEYISMRYLYLKKPSFKKLSLKLFILVTLFIIYKIQFPPYGLYKNYNHIKFDLTQIKTIVTASKNYFLFVIPIIILPIISFFLFQIKNYSRERLKGLIIPLSIIGLLLIAAIFPYVIVGKYPFDSDFYKWSYRHTLLLAIPLSLLFSFLSYQIHFSLKAKKFYVFVLVSLLIPFTYLFLGYYYKAKSNLYNQSLVYALKKIDLEKEGLVYIKLNEKASKYYLSVNYYDLNTIFFRAYGRAGWMGKVGYENFKEAYKLDKNERIFLRDKYRIKYCTSFVNPNCLINLNLIENKNVSFIDVVTSHYKDLVTIQIHNISCKKSNKE